MTPPDDDEPEYAPPQFIAQPPGEPARPPADDAAASKPAPPRAPTAADVEPAAQAEGAPQPADQGAAWGAPQPADQGAAWGAPQPADQGAAWGAPQPADQGAAWGAPQPADQLAAASAPQPADQIGSTATRDAPPPRALSHQVVGGLRSGSRAEPPAHDPGAPPGSAAADREPVLPSTYHDNDLRAAIGVPAMPEHIRPRRTPPADDDDRDDDDGRPRSRKAIAIAAISGVVGLGIAALVVLGRLSSDRYVIGCDAKEVVAGRGRSFPPWGTSSLGGDEWKPIKIPPSFQCIELETDDLDQLHDAYRKLLVDRADALLTAREVTQIDEAAAMLEQALLHARSDRKTDIDARKDIQRMLGDVGYWRASAKLRDAATTLAEAAKQFETAAGQLPRHVSDASAWAAYIRKLVDELRAGPAGAAPPPIPPAAQAERAPAPPGAALPVEPERGSAGSDAPPIVPPAAGAPTGGVLL